MDVADDKEDDCNCDKLKLVESVIKARRNFEKENGEDCSDSEIDESVKHKYLTLIHQY